MNSSFLTSAAVHTLENKWWKHNASFFRGFMTTNARVVFKSICCTISSWFNDSHFLCVFSFFLRFLIVGTLSKNCPKFYLVLIFGANIHIKKFVLFFSFSWRKKKRKASLHFLLLRVPPVVVIIVSHFAWIYECVRNYPTTTEREAAFIYGSILLVLKCCESTWIEQKKLITSALALRSHKTTFCTKWSQSDQKNRDFPDKQGQENINFE